MPLGRLNHELQQSFLFLPGMKTMYPLGAALRWSQVFKLTSL